MLQLKLKQTFTTSQQIILLLEKITNVLRFSVSWLSLCYSQMIHILHSTKPTILVQKQKIHVYIETCKQQHNCNQFVQHLTTNPLSFVMYQSILFTFNKNRLLEQAKYPRQKIKLNQTLVYFSHKSITQQFLGKHYINQIFLNSQHKNISYQIQTQRIFQYGLRQFAPPKITGTTIMFVVIYKLKHYVMIRGIFRIQQQIIQRIVQCNVRQHTPKNYFYNISIQHRSNKNQTTKKSTYMYSINITIFYFCITLLQRQMYQLR
eukprot:TRINITY_DN16283_c0_g1_i4.p1 TRINITY_DN16283_c0_g1~~TRINITY_DN16283_c0_g1_i4.p1  ORF type:complete len:289 (-),score=-31.33 TRINITY_DN16283_c0_g1_i4:339-1124(-)